MTKQEAIEILRDTPIDVRSTREDDIHTLYATAQGMAIEALSESKRDLSDDTIYRQDAIDALEEQLDYLQMLNKDENPTAESKWYGVNWARNTIADLPSAQPFNQGQSRIQSSDCISRQDAIDAVKHAWAKGLEPSQYIEILPSAQPEVLACGEGELSAQPEKSTCDLISRQDAIDAIRSMQTYKMFAGDDLLLVDQAGAQTELMLLPSTQPEQRDFEKQLHDMFDHIWECEIDHPVYQDTVGDLMSAVIQAHYNSTQPERKKGEWKRNITAERNAQLIFTKVYNCSECGYESVGNNLKNYCPNCGSYNGGES